MKIVIPKGIEAVSADNTSSLKYYGVYFTDNFGDMIKEIVILEEFGRLDIGSFPALYFEFDTVLELNNWLNS